MEITRTLTRKLRRGIPAAAVLLKIFDVRSDAEEIASKIFPNKTFPVILCKFKP